jgi:hypothetical protein
MHARMSVAAMGAAGAKSGSHTPALGEPVPESASALDIEMNPLVVARGVGKQLNLLLGDRDPVADGDFLANPRG